MAPGAMLGRLLRGLSTRKRVVNSTAQTMHSPTSRARREISTMAAAAARKIAGIELARTLHRTTGRAPLLRAASS